MNLYLGSDTGLRRWATARLNTAVMLSNGIVTDRIKPL